MPQEEHSRKGMGVIEDLEQWKSLFEKITQKKVQLSKCYQLQTVSQFVGQQNISVHLVSSIINKIADIDPLPPQNLDVLHDDKENLSIIYVLCELTKQCLACKTKLAPLNLDLTT